MNRTLPIVLAVAMFMEHFDSTVISTALPAIATDLGTDPIALKLALTAYLVSIAIFVPVSGWMADRFGANRVFRIAIFVFVVGSVLCAVSGSLGAFVVSRFIQGMGAAMMSPIARLVLVRATPRNALVGAMAWLAIPALVAPLAGPPVGGFIATYVSWHWIFIINVPIGLAGIVLAGIVVPDIEAEPPRPIDWRGFLLCGLAASGIVFGLSVVGLPAFPPLVGMSTTMIGLAAASCYVLHARRAAAPLFDLGLFRSRAFSASIAGGSLFRIGTGAIPFLLPLMFQLIFGLSPFESGLLTFVSAIGAITMKFLVPALVRSAGFRTVTVASAAGGGLLFAAAALFTAQTPYWLIVATLLASGFFRSLFFSSTNALLFSELDDRQASQATALAAAAQQVSIAVGVACAGGILEAATAFSGDLDRSAFVVAFLVTGAVAVLSALVYARLPGDVGAAVSGHVTGGHGERRGGGQGEP